MYIELRDAAGKLAAFLSPEDGVKNAWIDQRLNGECVLTFDIPLNCQKWQYVEPECKFIVGGKEFVILRPDAVDATRDDSGKEWNSVTAVESWHLLHKRYPTISNHPDELPQDLEVTILSGGSPTGGYPAGSAGSALTYLLAGSGWTLDICDVDGVHDLETEKLSLLENIEEVQKIWGGFLVWDSLDKKVSLRAESKWQNYHGFQVRYKKNEKNVTRTADYDIVTKLYPFGENDLDIASVNGGKKYIENHSYTDAVYTGMFLDQDIDDPQELLEKATQVLDKMCRPRYTYQVTILDLRVLPEYRHEKFEIGDLVDIIDDDLGTAEKIRIVGYKHNIFQPWQCELEIGEPEETLESHLAETIDVSKFVKDALRANPTISNILKGFIDTFSATINSANGKLLWDDGVFDAIEVDDDGLETGRRVRITSGGVGISADGGQTFKTAMTGDGILANTIICSMLYALSSEDGFTQMVGDGLRVYDAQGNLRAHIGTYGDGKYGVKIIGGEISSDTSIAGHSAADLETQDGAQQKASDAEQNAKTYTRTIIEQTENAIALKADKTTVDGLETRLSQAELKVQPGAIVSTVRSSTEYTNDLGLKVNKNQIISTINQSPESVTISASKINLSGYVTFTSLGGLAFKDNVSYSEVTGSKPPTDADNTRTTIDGGLVTTGTLQLQNANGYVYSGITASGTTSTSVRIWAGDNFDNRAVAPFRVLQSGEVRIGGSSASSPNVKILKNGSFYAGMGGGSRYYFQVPYNADGVYNCFKPSFSNYAAARWKRDDSNYIYQDPKTWLVRMGGATRLELYQPDPPHVNLFIGEYNESTTPTVFKGATLKALCESTSQLQVRSANDSAYIPIAASDFVTASKREYKEDIKLAESALKQVLETPVYNFAMKDEGRPRIGLVYEEAPETLRSMDGLSISDMVGMLWKAVQELNSKVDGLLS